MMLSKIQFYLTSRPFLTLWMITPQNTHLWPIFCWNCVSWKSKQTQVDWSNSVYRRAHSFKVFLSLLFNFCRHWYPSMNFNSRHEIRTAASVTLLNPDVVTFRDSVTVTWGGRPYFVRERQMFWQPEKKLSVS